MGMISTRFQRYVEFIRRFPEFFREVMTSDQFHWYDRFVLIEGILLFILMIAVGGPVKCRREHPKLGAAIGCGALIINIIALIIYNQTK